MILLDFVLFAAGFLMLIKGADILVKGASSIAYKKNVPQIVIGLTIVSFGTSTPELVVNLVASFNGHSEITIGNVVGSNIANILLILGISGLIYPLHTQKNTVWKEIPIALLSSIVILVLANDLFFNAGQSLLSAGDGIILLLFFAVFMGYIFAIMKQNNDPAAEIETVQVKKPILLVIGGIIGLTIGGKLIVDSAISIARMLEVSEAVIGFTLIAIGTSLPELATSAVAAYRKNSDIAIGNVVGSNIFNVFLIMGVSAVINPIPFNDNLNIDLLFLVFISLMLFFFMFTGKKRILDRWEGALFVILYAGYILRFFFLGT